MTKGQRRKFDEAWRLTKRRTMTVAEDGKVERVSQEEALKVVRQHSRSMQERTERESYY